MEFFTAILQRQSIRQFTGSPIPPDALHQILAAGLLAPSSCARYPLEFIAVTKKELLEALSRAKASGADFVKGAAAAVVVLGNTEASDAWIEDGAVAMEHMHLCAAALGLGSCWVECRGRFTTEKKEDGTPVSADEYLRPLLSIPDKYDVLAFLALGQPRRIPHPRSEDRADFSKVHEETF